MDGVMQMHRSKAAVIGVVVLALGLWLAPASSARSKASRTVSLAGVHIDDDGWINWWPQSCNHKGVCKLKGSGIVHYTGVLHGISQHETWFSYDPATNRISNDTYEWYTVTIDGCGTGRFFTHEYGSYDPAELMMMQDPATGKVQGGQGTWRLVPGTQTGDLTRMSSFYFQVDHVAFEFPTFENHETMSRGTAVCN
jgi:hypothetical protein